MNNRFFITPCLWFDHQAEEAAKFYTSLFPDSRAGKIMRYGKEGFEYHKKPAGSVMTVDFELNGQPFIALNGGPLFPFNESVSFFVYCGSEKETDFLYKKLSDGGSVNMPLDKYDWSSKYAWVKDKFGVSWQLALAEINPSQKIVPALLFVNEKCNLVKEAITHLIAIFPNSEMAVEYPYDKSMNMPEGTLLFAQFRLNGYLMNAMSGGTIKHNFDYNEAISFIIECENQQQIDYYWAMLSEGGEEGMCGWLKDKYGISWQIVPSVWNDLVADPQNEIKAMRALFTMRKIMINELIEATK